jgi:ribokinase/non-canonical purine NTP pyrophosphatase (RdgB/HAM1 family)
VPRTRLAKILPLPSLFCGTTPAGRVGLQYDEEKTVLSGSTTTGVAPIVVETESGDNMIIVVPGANYALTPAEVDASLRALPNKPSIVLVQLEIPPETALQALKTGKELGATTILNPAPAPEGWNLDEFFPFCDILIPNETEIRNLCGNSHSKDEEALAHELLAKGVNTVLVTLGARGAMAVSKHSDKVKTTMISASPDLPCRNDPVQDTIGAGDAFCGALATYLSAGLPLNEAATKACGVASMTVRKRGAQSSYPTAEELPKCLQISNASSSKQRINKPAITFVTGNKKKVEEVQQILREDELPFHITNRNLDLPELQGDPEDIAKEKCRIAAKEIGGAVFIEVTSLCFNALHGLPGPYIKWFLERCGHDGLNDMLHGFDDKTAFAQTIVAFCASPSSPVEIFDGRTDGRIVRPRGSLEYGWDPVFEPAEGNNKTYAEMSSAEKNAVSQRGRSFKKFRKYLTDRADEITSKIRK